MAEAAGLALRAVALVSLFQTAVELFEYFEAARSLASDRDLAANKLSLLEERLKQWGDCMHVQHPGEEDGVLRKHWVEEGGLVTNSLKGISEILGNAAQLRDKYGLHKKRRLTWRSDIPLLHRTNTSRSLLRKPSKIAPSIRKQAAWAIKDKKRSDSLIYDLDFLITNLERVSGRLLKLGMQRHPRFPNRSAFIDNVEVECPDFDETAPSNPQSTMSSDNRNGLMIGLARERQNRHGTPSSAPSQETHHEYKDVTSSGNACHPCGDMDMQNSRKNKYEKVTANDWAYQPLGNGTSAGHVALLKQQQEGYKNSHGM